jgi:acetylornithine deacetylase
MIQGGTAPNITAEHCSFVAEVRAIPGETAADYISAYRAFIRDEIEPAMHAIAPEVDGEAEALTRRLTGDNGRHVVAYGTEGGIFQAAGWSTVVCGPGDIAQAHQPDEYIEISEMVAGERFVRSLIRTLAT